MPNVELLPPKRLPAFRKIAIGTWRMSRSPAVYGAITVRMEPALAYLEEFRRVTGKRLTVTHLVAKAVATALERVPEANAILRMNKVYQRRRVSVFLQVAMTDPETGRPDLSGARIEDVDKKSLAELVSATEAQVELVRTRKDASLERSRKSFRFVPHLLLGPLLDLLAFLLYTLNLDLRAFGLPKDGFGSVMVTNIGSLGLDEAYVPLVPWSRVPLLVTVGKVSDAPVVDDGKLVAGKVMRLTATFDHRFIDGAHAAVLVRTVEEVFRDPAGVFGAPQA